MVRVGLPAIGRSFHADAIGLQWVVDAYLLLRPLVVSIASAAILGSNFRRNSI
jgi:hypothetical protein